MIRDAYNKPLFSDEKFEKINKISPPNWNEPKDHSNLTRECSLVDSTPQEGGHEVVFSS